tara:strand:+ start:1546 stop:3117 length:1572 start_codon:yes stop_codon:yes gene_type:complete
MGLLDNTTNQDYYQGNNYGNYQFTSLSTIINQFKIGYIGEDKIISKMKRADIAFYAMRAIQELSFDTFKSIKSQEIVLQPTLQMILPHDYVNYTQVSWSDAGGIKHPLYPTYQTSNPFKIKQDEDGNYDFAGIISSIPDFNNANFSTNLNNSTDWTKTGRITGNVTLDNVIVNGVTYNQTSVNDFFNRKAGKLTAEIHKEYQAGNTGPTIFGRHYSCWQEIDVTNIDEINISAEGFAPADADGFVGATVRMGISKTKGDTVTNPFKLNNPSSNGLTDSPKPVGPNFISHTSSSSDDGLLNLAYVEWLGSTTSQSGKKSLNSVNVANHTKLFVLITMFVPGDLTGVTDNAKATLTLDNIDLNFEGSDPNLQRDGDSTTWNNFKALTPGDNIDQYDDGTYDLVIGERYGLEPQNAQVNGSFYIDELKGLIHFSSNVSGKTVVLDYISDGLGTDEEMIVHKFAEEAMYKHIAYAILSSRSNVPEYIVRRFQKEKFAAVRKAKLRLSNIKLEEITQVLRGKSKWIKH